MEAHVAAKWGGKVAHEVKGTGAPDLVGTIRCGTALQQEAIVSFKSHSACHGEFRWNGQEPGFVDDLNH